MPFSIAGPMLTAEAIIQELKGEKDDKPGGGMGMGMQFPDLNVRQNGPGWKRPGLFNLQEPETG